MKSFELLSRDPVNFKVEQKAIMRIAERLNSRVKVKENIA